jgi:hypothetical protein
MAKKKEIRFDFESATYMNLDDKGRFRCEICYRKFLVSGVDITLDDFTICPFCLKSGPQVVASKAMQNAENKDRIAEEWQYDESDPLDQQNIAGMAKQYRTLAKQIQGLDSFEDLRGGKFAMEIANSPPGTWKREAA